MGGDVSVTTLSVAALLLVVVALSGCGTGHSGAGHSGAGQPAPSRSSLAQSQPPEPSASPSAQALNPAALVGKTLFGLDDSNAVCQSVLDGTPAPMLPSPGSAGPGDDPAADTASAVANGVGTLTPGGLLVLDCYPDSNATNSTLIAFNLFTRTAAWQFSLPGDDTYMFGTSHLFLISHHTKPATGLQSASTRYTLTAVDLTTGAKSWPVPYFADEPNSGDNGIVALTEGPSGIPGHPQSVVITYLGTSAYDTQTGASLWHIPTEYDTQANGSYALAGVVEIYGYQDNYYDSHITGFGARTDKELWDLRLKVSCASGTDSEDDVFQGLVEWEFSDSCFQAHNVATGQLVADQAFPSSWQSVVATPTAVLEYDGSKLSFFKMPDLRHPIWSQPAGPTTPLAVSSGHVLVAAPSGLLVLSAADGSIISSVPTAVFPGDGSYSIVDGLVVQGSEDGATSVLELDPPQ
jgi:hypothetical protein